jgi:hypothetical protein
VRRALRSRLALEAGIVLFFLALSLVATRPLVFHMGSATFAGYDPLTHLWTVHWLTTHFFNPAQVFEGNLYYPHRHAVLFTEIDLGSVVLLLPFHVLVNDPVRLVNLACILALTFGAWSFHILVRFLTRSAWAGVGSGVLAAFGSNQVRHLPHLDVLTVGWIALFLLALHAIVQRPSWPFVFLAGASLALTVQSNGYYAVAIVLVFGLFSLLFLRPALFGPFLAVVLLAVVLAGPYLLAYASLHAEHRLHRGIGWSEHMAFHPSSDLGNSGYVEGSVLGREGECLFPGFLTLILAGLTLVRPDRTSRFYSLAVLLLLVVSLGPSFHWARWSFPLPYRLLIAVPPLDSMRHPLTFAGVAGLLLAVLAGLGFARSGLLGLSWGGPLFVCLAVCETLSPGHPLAPLPEHSPPIFQALAELPPGAALEIPVLADEVLLCAARTERPFLNGQVSSFFPRETGALDDFITKEWLQETPSVVDRTNSSFLLDNYPFRYLVLPRGRLEVLGFGALSRALETSPVFVRLAQTPDGDRIYEVRKGAQPE